MMMNSFSYGNLLYKGVLYEPMINSFSLEFEQPTYHIDEKKTIQTIEKHPEDAESTKSIMFFDSGWNCVHQFS